MAGVTKEEIAWAKELDLLTYFKLVEPGNLKLVGKEYQRRTKRRTEVCRHPPSQPPRATRKVSPDGTLKPGKDIQPLRRAAWLR